MNNKVTKILRICLVGRQKNLYWLIKAIDNAGWSVEYNDNTKIWRIMWKKEKVVNTKKGNMSKWFNGHVEIDICFIGDPEVLDLLFAALSKNGWKFSFVRYNGYSNKVYELWRE